MKNAHGVKIQPADDRLQEVKEQLLEQMKWMMHLVECDVHPDRIEAEYKTCRDLISRRNTVYIEKQREDRRHALA